MAVRTFIDNKGEQWIVWSTVPAASDSLKPEYRDGWLTFSGTTERRRLAPIPPGWETFTARELEALCDRAEWSDGD